MYNGKKILAIIPARGGSKRLPNKNIKNFCGKPLIAWSIVAAKKSKYIDEFIVSTDDLKIANIAKKYGARVPFLRPEALSTDDAKSVDVVLHSINWFITNENKKFDIIVLLQPTSPLREDIDINKSIEFYFKKNALSVASICEADHNPQWINFLSNEHKIKFLYNSKKTKSKKFYRLNGAIYILNTEFLLKKKKILYKNTYGYVMEKHKSIDIDDIFDFNIAEYIMKLKFKSIN